MTREAELVRALREQVAHSRRSAELADKADNYGFGAGLNSVCNSIEHILAVYEQAGAPSPTRRQIVLNWMMGEGDLRAKDGWWGGSDTIATVDKLLSALDTADEQAGTSQGDYSCATCGTGMTEPCEHWKAMLEMVPSVDADEQASASPEGYHIGVIDESKVLRAPDADEQGAPEPVKGICDASYPTQLHEKQKDCVNWRPAEPKETE